MRFIYLVVLTTFVFANSSQAQQAPSSFTLEQAITYALENSDNAKNASIDRQIADAKVKETRGIGLPQISAAGTILQNEKLPRFFALKPVAYGFSSASDQSNPNYVDYNNFFPGVPDDGVLAGQNFFQLKSNGQAGISVSQILFNASYLVGLQAASAYRELSEKQEQQTKEQIIQNVAKAYYGVLINQERLKLFDVNIARVDSLFRSTKAFNTNGFAEGIEVDRIEVALNNLMAERDKFLNLQSLSVELLKFQMNYPVDQDITLTASIDQMSMDKDLAAVIGDFDYSERIEYKVLETNRKLQQLNIKNKYSEGLPSLVAFADFGYSTQSADIAGVFRTESNIPDNNPYGFSADKWYQTQSFGVTLNVPLFSGLQRTYRLKQERLTALKIENGFNSLKRGIDVEVKQSNSTYKNALRSLETQDRNMKLAEKIARITKLKYEQGVGSNLEVVDAESALREAQINYYNALYDALVSRVDLMKAYGKIETLNTPTSQN